MPLKCATPGSSKRRAPSADAGPTSRKRSQRVTAEGSARQASVSWGDDEDQSRHHVPRDHRSASPAKGVLRRNEPADPNQDDEDVEYDSEEAIRAEYARAAEQAIAAKRAGGRGARSTGRRAVEEPVEEDVYDDEDASVTPSNASSDDEKYAVGAQDSSTTTVTKPATRAFSGGRVQAKEPAQSRTATSTSGGVVRKPSATPKTAGRKPSATTQSVGQELGGGLIGLDFIVGPRDKPGKLQTIFATNGVFGSFDKDEVLAHNMSNLVSRVVSHARQFYGPPIPSHKRSSFFDELLQKENKHLIRYLGCLAIAGSEGEQSWVKLLTEGSTRDAFVIGVIGRALKEHVFGDLWFGGKPAQKAKIEKLEKSEAFENLDGFSRTEQRADTVKTFVAPSQESANRTTLEETCATLAARLDTMLEPFLGQKRSVNSSERRKGLYDIVHFAGRLSRIMRQAPDVVYYWPPTFKDEEFEPSRMECLNLKNMILNSPYEKQEVQGIERAVVRKGHKGENTEAIVQVVCFPGLVAYRQYGGETGAKEIAAENNRGGIREPDDVRRARQYRVKNGVEQIPDPNAHGFRSRVVCKSVVYLTWGKQRLLTREAGTSAHIDAVREGPAGMKKYEDDYSKYKELYDIAEARWAGQR